MGGGELTSSQVDSPASHSAWPDSERERMMTATSGRNLSGLYEKSSPLGWLVKTLVESSQWYSPAMRLKWEAKRLYSERITEKEYCYDSSMSSKPSVATLSEKDIPSGRLLFRLVPSERRTEGTGCGLLPTAIMLQAPTAVQTVESPEKMRERVMKNGYKNGTKYGSLTSQILYDPRYSGLLPTPRAMEVIEHPAKQAERLKDRTGTKLNNLSSGAKFGLLPTPMASDATTGAIIGENDTFITTKNGTPRKINQNGTNGSVGLARMVQILPTARCFKNGSKPEDGRTKRKLEQGWTMELDDLASCDLLPTPRTSDYKGAATLENIEKRGRNPLTNSLPDRFAQNGATSQLNPLFVEEMMGFPLMWTALPYLFPDGDKNPLKDSCRHSAASDIGNI